MAVLSFALWNDCYLFGKYPALKTGLVFENLGTQQRFWVYLSYWSFWLCYSFSILSVYADITGKLKGLLSTLLIGLAFPVSFLVFNRTDI